jgi:protein deglycase
MSDAVRILVPLAEGFEEIEAIVPVDLFRRAGFEVTTAALAGNPVRASRGTVHVADAFLGEVLERDFTLIYLPGGLPGADHLAAHGPLLRRLQAQAQAGGWIAAICAAPKVLAAAGLLEGRRFTIHPGSAQGVRPLVPQPARVVVDGKLVTGIGAGASFELALRLVERLAGPARVDEINRGLLCPAALLPPESR